MAFTELPDGEYMVNGKSFTKSGNAFTLDGKTLNANEIEKATRTTSEKMRKTVEETVSDAEIADTPKAEAAKSEVSDKSDKKETAVPSAEKSAPEKNDESGNTVLFSKVTDSNGQNFSNTVEQKEIGIANSFIEVNGEIIPLAEGIDFNADKDMQQVVKDYISILQGEHFQVEEDGTDVYIDSISATEYTQSKYTDKIRKQNTDLFKAKAKAAAIVGSIINKAKNGKDERVNKGHSRNGKNGIYRRYDIQFATPSGENDAWIFTGQMVVWIPYSGKANFYDITNIIKIKQKIHQVTKIVTDGHGTDTSKGVSDPQKSPANANKISSIDSKINPSSSKNPENSSGGMKFSMSCDLDLGDTSLSPEDYRRSIDPLFDFVMEYTDGIVNPGPDHIGEDFDGSYISEAYNKFSTKRKQGKKESDSSYQRYLAHRQKMLNKADGYPLDTLAAYVDKFGGDEKEVAEKILDMLRYLRKRDLTFIHKDHQQPIANQLIKQSEKSYLNDFEIIP